MSRKTKCNFGHVDSSKSLVQSFKTLYQIAGMILEEISGNWTDKMCCLFTYDQIQYCTTQIRTFDVGWKPRSLWSMYLSRVVQSFVKWYRVFLLQKISYSRHSKAGGCFTHWHTNSGEDSHECGFRILWSATSEIRLFIFWYRVWYRVLETLYHDFTAWHKFSMQNSFGELPRTKHDSQLINIKK